MEGRPVYGRPSIMTRVANALRAGMKMKSRPKFDLLTSLPG
jgi:hypothetical protein